MPKTALLLAAAILSSCKLGPFPDEPVLRPTAPEPSWDGAGKPTAEAKDAGAYDAALELAH